MSQKKVSNSEEMTFWEHLDELRKVLFRSAILIVVLMAVIFAAKDFVFDKVVLAPISSDFLLYRLIDKILVYMDGAPLSPFKLELINIDLSAQFFAYKHYILFCAGYLHTFHSLPVVALYQACTI